MDPFEQAMRWVADSEQTLNKEIHDRRMLPGLDGDLFADTERLRKVLEWMKQEKERSGQDYYPKSRARG